MSGTAKTVAAVAGGYLLGRTKKMKLAIMMAGLLAGKKLPTSGKDLQEQLKKLADENPEIGGLVKQIQGNLNQAARAAAVTAATQQVNRLSDSLHERAESLRAGPQDEDAEAEGDEPEDQRAEDEVEDTDTQDAEADEATDDESSGR